MDVFFKHNVNDLIETPYGKGVVTMLCYDDGGVKYYVELPECGKWISESLLDKTL